MAYSKPFQEVLDEIEKMSSNKEDILVIREHFRKEMLRLGPKERINNLYMIRPKRAIPGRRARYLAFRMNKMQEHYWDNRTNRDSILKMRQGGTTTLSCIIALDMCLFGLGTNAAIMAEVLPNVKKYFRITKNAFTQFQNDWGDLYPVTNTIDNAFELLIGETGSLLMVCTETKGLTLDFLHISEAAFVQEKRILESLESVPLSGHVIMESTPDGASGLFFKSWDSFLKRPDNSMFTGHFYPWWWQYPEVEDIDCLKRPKEVVYTDKEEDLINTFELDETHILFRRLKISESGDSEAEFLKKYPEDPVTCFLSGASSIFSADIVRSLWIHNSDPAFKGDLRISNV
jgi:hypothetical protein